MLSLFCLRRAKNAIELPSRMNNIHKIKFNVGEAAHYNVMSDLLSTNLRQEAERTYLSMYCSILL